MEPKVCESCNHLCEAVQVKFAMDKSEWYCPACHKSYEMFRLENGDLLRVA